MPRAVESPFVCAECGKSFARRSDLNRHIAIHEPDATRFHCAYPECTYRSLQKSNLKTHYISKHLNQRPHKCKIDECGRAYGDASALIRHEKKHHGYFRKAQKPYERPSSSKKPGRNKSELDLYALAESDSHDTSPTPSPVPSFGYSSCTSSSPAPSTYPSTPFTSVTPFQSLAQQQDTLKPQTTDEFLHEMIPELFPDPKLTQSMLPLGSAFDMTFGNPFQRVPPRHTYFGMQMPMLDNFRPTLGCPF